MSCLRKLICAALSCPPCYNYCALRALDEFSFRPVLFRQLPISQFSSLFYLPNCLFSSMFYFDNLSILISLLANCHSQSNKENNCQYLSCSLFCTIIALSLFTFSTSPVIPLTFTFQFHFHLNLHLVHFQLFSLSVLICNGL